MIAPLKLLIEGHGDEQLLFAGFVAASGVALFIDVTIYWLLLPLVSYAFLAAACGYFFGVISHYFMSSRVVFADRFQTRGVVAEAPTVAKFFASGFVGLVVTASVVGLLTDVLGMHPLLAKIAAAGCSFIGVFLILRLFVFNQQSAALAANVQ